MDGRTMTVPADKERLAAVLEFIEDQLKGVTCSRRTMFQIDVAVEEIFVNIASYAYRDGCGEVSIGCRIDGEGILEITLTDQGISYNPLDREEPDITLGADRRKPGGLGIFLARKSMDEISYMHQNQNNILTLRKKLE